MLVVPTKSGSIMKPEASVKDAIKNEIFRKVVVPLLTLT